MTIETATFAVQRGTTQYGVSGDDIGDKLADGDVLAVSRGGVTKHFTYNGSNIDDIDDSDLLACTDTDDVTYSVTGDKFKALFGPPGYIIAGVNHYDLGIPSLNYTEILLADTAEDIGLPIGVLDPGSTCQMVKPQVKSKMPIKTIRRSSLLPGVYAWFVKIEEGTLWRDDVEAGGTLEFDFK